MRALARVALLLTLVLVSLSAYLRLAHSGIGCDGWPECYGRIGQPESALVATPPDQAYQKLVERGGERLAWATPLHRLVASVLGLVVLALVVAAFAARRSRRAALLLLAAVVGLATLGLWSGGLHSPAIVMGNLVGGFVTLGLVGWIAARAAPPAAATGDRAVALAALVALVAIAGQIVLGGATSANFAATACPTVPDCNGVWLPDATLATALDFGREHALTETGTVVGGAERVAMQLAHRWGALLATLAVVVAAVLAWRAGGGLRAPALLMVVALLAELAVGIASVLTALPIRLAVLHNALAAILLLASVWSLARSRG